MPVFGRRRVQAGRRFANPPEKMRVNFFARNHPARLAARRLEDSFAPLDRRRGNGNDQRLATAYVASAALVYQLGAFRCGAQQVQLVHQRQARVEAHQARQFGRYGGCGGIGRRVFDDAPVLDNLETVAQPLVGADHRCHAVEGDAGL